MVDIQMWLVRVLPSVTAVGNVMHTAWAWPLAESLHFIGLTLLIGTVGLFDLRLLGVAKNIPAAALHRIAPYGIAGFVLCLLTGALFLMTEPDQYIYNPSFHWKMLFMLAAGVNASVFYTTSYRAALVRGEAPAMPGPFKFFGLASLVLWMLVIVTGRALTFYRPFPCEPEPTEWLATCIPGFFGR
jgi:hypothetical protein